MVERLVAAEQVIGSNPIVTFSRICDDGNVTLQCMYWVLGRRKVELSVGEFGIWVLCRI